MMRNKWMKVSLFVAGLAILLVLVGLALMPAQGQLVAHHMAPNDNSTTVGQLNEEMVHNGWEVVDGTYIMPAVGVGSGEMSRAQDPWMAP